LREMARSETLVRSAAAWAARLGAELDLIYADELRQSSPEVHDLGLQEAYREEWERERKEDLDSLNTLMAMLPEAVRGRVHAVGGKSAAEAIVDQAEHADLIIVATHGRTGVTSWLVGSVAEKVVRTCPRPVLVLRAPSAT
jgi:nucleotide-binding universal stress UspA family protein